MFQSNFCFYKGYIIFKCVKMQEYMDYINNLFGIDIFEVFGLYVNVDIT